ncbi:hypothetical protein PIB30_060919, partial [Stylosanthes scabra]|nr:hypothetical protein [Stylosanthes scabra]
MSQIAGVLPQWNLCKVSLKQSSPLGSFNGGMSHILREVDSTNLDNKQRIDSIHKRKVDTDLYKGLSSTTQLSHFGSYNGRMSHLHSEVGILTNDYARNARRLRKMILDAKRRRGLLLDAGV